ncbi:MAG: hypothetical protein Q8P67_14425 [archaeon]|nr:hypothetical protein [archaeon]
MRGAGVADDDALILCVSTTETVVGLASSTAENISVKTYEQERSILAGSGTPDQFWPMASRKDYLNASSDFRGADFAVLSALWQCQEEERSSS